LVACSLPFAPDDVHEQNHSGEDYFGKPPGKPTDNLGTQLVSRAQVILPSGSCALTSSSRIWKVKGKARCSVECTRQPS
jgi:hypothetical protein